MSIPVQPKGGPRNTIRLANNNDIEEIIRLTKEEESLIRQPIPLSGERLRQIISDFECLVVEQTELQQGSPVRLIAFLLFHRGSPSLTDHSSVFQDLVVPVEYRQKEIEAICVLERVSKISSEANYSYMSWWVDDWNTAATTLYKRITHRAPSDTHPSQHSIQTPANKAKNKPKL
ncbi:uncharacterized protein LOC110441167 [Mizuhopecten yessoensis]|uniref:N-acetyltransferase domain-containing protein n=1 Tax=Mizuhopecten yessoensis TaxID=6573 RepID=A0A210PJW2_MIZYE|nr:uncharacterized protein LOC110441167 [Mizuhopecten yessoensis]XP_021339941.1 uncharacterized protein LOC110441167 [Mizuhopecten yessoensis]OWF36765.1 hypothetical protein KP79_PYT02896 [Mizuhopecten yessoensis]